MQGTRSQKKKKRSKGPVILLVLLVLLVICFAVGSRVYKNKMEYYRNFNEAFDPNSDAEIDFVVPSGSGTQKIANMLESDGLIADATTFRMKSRLCGYDGTWQAGSFKLSPSMTTEEIVEKLQNAMAETVRFTIPEGYTVKQIGEKLAKDGLIDSPEDFYEACEGEFVYEFLDGVEAQYEDPTGTVSAQANRLEGYLFPSTYEVYTDATPKEIAGTMLRQFDKVYSELVSKYPESDALQNYSMQEIVTIASLIERETRVDADRPLVASVIYNRLNKKMKLQLDCTIQYALGEVKERVLYSDLEIDSPYNTYKIDGIPAAPIASPGKASIEAAINPENTKYIYYVLKPDGSGAHNFAETDAQFQKYKQEYLNSL